MTDDYTEFSAKKADRLARSYNPADDDRAERIRALGDDMTPAMRVALGHHDLAREAAKSKEQ